MSVKKEVRFLKGCELRSTGNKLSGYAAVYNSPSLPLPDFTEIIRPGAFDRALREKQNVVLLYNHNPSALLARTVAQTLHLSSDSHGLFFEATLPQTSLAQDIRELVRTGNLSGMSFSFQCLKDSWTSTDRRELLDLNLGDVSIVTEPAYPAANVQAREAAFPEGIPDELRAHLSDPTRKVNPTYSAPPPVRPLAAKMPSFKTDEDRLAYVNQRLGVNPKSKQRSNYMDYPMSASQKSELRKFLLSGEYRDLTTTTGAAFVPEAFNRQIFASMKAYDAIFSDAVNTTIETTTGAPYDLFALDDTESAATIVGEGVADSEQDPTTYKTQLGQAPEWDTGVVKVSIALLQDAGVNLDSMLSQAFGVRLARGIAPSLITALLSGAKLGTTATGDQNTSGATGATTIGYQDLIALKKSVDPSYRASGKVYWLMNDDTLTALDSLTDKQGHPIIPQTYVNGQRTLLGYPVGICPSLPDIGAGATPIVFGATGFVAFRRVESGGALIRLAERYVDTLEIGYKSHLRANGALLCAGGVDSPVKYLQNAA